MKKILILESNPKHDLALNREIRDLSDRLRHSRNGDQFDIQIRLAVRPTDLQLIMHEVEPQIVHFCGHGAGNLGLVLESQSGKDLLSSTEALSSLFKLFTNQVECIVLNACYSQVQANAIVEHINYVIGINQAIRDDAAIAFSIGFYTALGYGRSIEDAYEFGCNEILLRNPTKYVSPLTSRKAINLDASEELRLPEHQKPVLKKKENINLIEPAQLPVKLISERGVDYTKLQNLLNESKWKEADEETTKVMCNAASWGRGGWLNAELIKAFPCKDLDTINRLWLHYSKGQFGFSVQKELWNVLVGTSNPNWQTFWSFWESIGLWRIHSFSGKQAEKIVFSLKAPLGCLPSTIWMLSGLDTSEITPDKGSFWQEIGWVKVAMTATPSLFGYWFGSRDHDKLEADVQQRLTPIMMEHIWNKYAKELINSFLLRMEICKL